MSTLTVTAGGYPGDGIAPGAAYANAYTISGAYAIYYNDKGEQKTVVGDPFREYARFITYTTEHYDVFHLPRHIYIPMHIQ